MMGPEIDIIVLRKRVWWVESEEKKLWVELQCKLLVWKCEKKTGYVRMTAKREILINATLNAQCDQNPTDVQV